MLSGVPPEERRPEQKLGSNDANCLCLEARGWGGQAPSTVSVPRCCISRAQGPIAVLRSTVGGAAVLPALGRKNLASIRFCTLIGCCCRQELGSHIRENRVLYVPVACPLFRRLLRAYTCRGLASRWCERLSHDNNHIIPRFVLLSHSHAVIRSASFRRAAACAPTPTRSPLRLRRGATKASLFVVNSRNLTTGNTQPPRALHSAIYAEAT